MSSPAKAHFMRKSAASSQAAETPAHANANQYELMLMKLAQDKRRLKEVQSIERKAEVKREILPEYVPWVEGVLTGEQGVQDDVLMTAMVWRTDVGDLVGALEIGRYAIAHKLAMPDQYARSTGCILAEEFAGMSLKAMAAGSAADTDALIAVDELTNGEDMPDEVRAKLHKAIGLGLSATDKPAALEHLRRAFSLHDKAGVKKEIERLERDLKNSADTENGDG